MVCAEMARLQAACCNKPLLTGGGVSLLLVNITMGPQVVTNVTHYKACAEANMPEQRLLPACAVSCCKRQGRHGVR